MGKIETLAKGCLLAGAAFTSTSAGAAVIYTFESYSTYSLGETLATFTYESPSFVTTDTDFTPDSCTVTVPAGQSCVDPQQLMPDFGPGYDTVGLRLNDTTYYFYFDDGVMGSIGSYKTVLFGDDQAGRLTVALAGAIPEPAAWLMLIVGFGAIGGAMRSRAVRQRSALAR